MKDWKTEGQGGGQPGMDLTEMVKVVIPTWVDKAIWGRSGQDKKTYVRWTGNGDFLLGTNGRHDSRTTRSHNSSEDMANGMVPEGGMLQMEMATVSLKAVNHRSGDTVPSLAFGEGEQMVKDLQSAEAPGDVPLL